MHEALEGLQALRARAARVGVQGHREYNPGWHPALALETLLTVSEAITRAAIYRKESRGAHFREDYPDKDAEHAKVNLLLRKSADGTMGIHQSSVPELTDEQRQIIEEMR